MNWIQFARLIHTIYSRGSALPDLDWIERQGLLAVKLAQVHALRIDFLDRDKCEHLARLYRRNNPLPAEDFNRLLSNLAVADFRQNFSDISNTPLATASVGQVHRARLHSGEQVVIKALKGDVRSAFRRDVRSLKRLFRLANLAYPPLRRVGDPVGILEDLEELTSVELDLRNEVAGAKVLNDIRERYGQIFDLSQMCLPTVHESLSNSDVMVSEFIDEPSLDELLERGALDYSKLLELFRIQGFCMFVVGKFHGDLHPGNVLVGENKFCLVDTAFIGTVSDRLRRGLFRFFEALSRYDYPACAEALHAMSVRELEASTLRRFQSEFLDLYADFNGATVSEVSLTSRMMQTIKLGVRSGMSFDRGMFSIIRSLMYLDGMVLRCNPDAVLVRDMRPSIDEMLSHSEMQD